MSPIVRIHFSELCATTAVIEFLQTLYKEEPLWRISQWILSIENLIPPGHYHGHILIHMSIEGEEGIFDVQVSLTTKNDVLEWRPALMSAYRAGFKGDPGYTGTFDEFSVRTDNFDPDRLSLFARP